MPLAIDPAARFKIVLASDAEKKPPPTFVFRFASNREFKALAAVCDQVEELQSQGAAALLGKMEETLKLFMVGWENMVGSEGGEIPYEPDELDALLNPAELSELLFGVMEHVQVEAEERKKSPSQSRSSTGKSAKTAARRKSA